ncbi:hypothetical protein BUALT_Bualt07G0125600 [Buddleja alternifolia]|uniref:Uncharacterized protein n=1 Tax=Buddleja alternifolia TaxID=168488 RepID=A0AAV6XGY0_9LAMI|nr:hypothetical protein BUALT_Bualt07G0125600 [Buddleja alternifolia]
MAESMRSKDLRDSLKHQEVMLLEERSLRQNNEQHLNSKFESLVASQNDLQTAVLHIQTQLQSIVEQMQIYNKNKSVLGEGLAPPPPPPKKRGSFDGKRGSFDRNKGSWKGFYADVASAKRLLVMGRRVLGRRGSWSADVAVQEPFWGSTIPERLRQRSKKMGHDVTTGLEVNPGKEKGRQKKAGVVIMMITNIIMTGKTHLARRKNKPMRFCRWIMTKAKSAEPATPESQDLVVPASITTSGKVIWSRQNEVQTVKIYYRALEDTPWDTEDAPCDNGVVFKVLVKGNIMTSSVKRLGICKFYSQSLKHNHKGRLIALCGDGQYSVHCARTFRERFHGSAMEVDNNYIHHKFSVDHIYGSMFLGMSSNDFICFYDWDRGSLIYRVDVKVKVRKL